MPELSIADKLELLISEISALKTAINNNNHSGWSPASHKLSDISNDVESMFVGQAGLYQDAANTAAYLDMPIIPDDAFFNWGNRLTTIHMQQPITSIGDRSCSGTSISWTEIPSTVTHLGISSLSSTNINISALPLGLIYIGDSALSSTDSHISTLPSTLTYIGNNVFDRTSTVLMNGSLPSGLTNIGDYAFYHYDRNNQYVSTGEFSGNVPQNLTYIGQYAFYGCKNLTLSGDLVNVNDESTTPIRIGQYAFAVATNDSDTNLTIGGNLKGRLRPATYAFYGRKEITFSGPFPSNYYDGTINIPAYVFYNCAKLAFAQDDLSAGNILQYAYYNCERINVRKSITTTGPISEYAFYNCKQMEVSDSITANGPITNRAFYDCNSMEATNGISAKIYIGPYAFYNDIGSTTYGALKPSIITIENAQNTGSGNDEGIIGPYAFGRQDLTGLTHLLIKSTYSGQLKIAYRAFVDTKFDNTNLTIELDSSSASLAFYEVSNPQSAYASSFKNSRLTGVTFIGNIPYINAYTFYECSNLSSVTFSPSTTRIGKYAFSSTDLNIIVLPTTITQVNDFAFAFSSITSVTINAYMTTCGFGIFAGNINLTSVTISNGVVEIGDCCFAPLHGVYTGGGINFTGAVTVPSSVLRFGDAVFSRSKLSTLIFNNGIKKIGVIPAGWYNEYYIDSDHNSYYDLQNVCVAGDLTTTAIPNTVEEFGGFLSWHLLTSFTIKSNVKKFGTFYCCDQLSTITIEEGLEEFGMRVSVKDVDVDYYTRDESDIYPLMYTQIQSITFPTTLKKLGPCMFSQQGINPSGYSNLQTVRIQSDCLQEPYNDGGVGDGVGLFEQNSDILDIYLSNVTKIPKKTFYNLYNFDSACIIHLNAPNLKEIGVSAFDHATFETDDPRSGVDTGIRGSRLLGIPDTIETIGSRAFGHDGHHMTIVFDGNPDTSKLTIAADAFYENPNIGTGGNYYLRVPWSKGDVYEGPDPTRPWGMPESHITYNYSPA